MASKRHVLAGIILTAFVGIAVLVLPFTQGLVNLSYDLGFLFRPQTRVDDVVIVYMDEESEARLGQGRWDRWDRTVHARLLNRLTEAGASVVVFDVLFWPEGTNAFANRQLIDAVKRHGKVAVAAKPTFVVHDAEVIGPGVTKPFDELAAASTWGMVEVSDANKAVRQHYGYNVFEIPSLAWRAAELAGARLPSKPFAERWVNYYGAGGDLPHVRYADVLETNFPAAATFSNKVVFVGAAWSLGFTGGKGTDDFRTPHTLWTGQKSPGVEIITTTYLNLKRGDWLWRLPPIAEATAVGIVGIAIAIALMLMKPMAAAKAAVYCTVAVAMFGILGMWVTHIWFPWMIVAAVQTPTALAWAVLAHTLELQQEKRLLQQQLAIVEMREAKQRLADSEHERAASAAISAFKPQDNGKPSVPDHELLRRIGKGAYGEVWLARDIIGSYHAVKIVFRSVFDEDRPFEREFEGLRHFTPISRTHAGFIHILHVGRNEAAQYFYSVMELGDDETRGQTIDPEKYAARTLASELRRRRPLPLEECLELGEHLAAALQHLHDQRLVHRDIKPSNIIYVDGVAKFADIGLVTEAASDNHTVTYLGTKGYIAPEGPGTPAADIYALGKVLYQAAFGVEVERYPELPTAIVQDPGQADLFFFNRIVLNACAADPARRYQSASELRAALADARKRTRGVTAKVS
jgi:CHASE2 domain-containing sensor protein